MLRTTKNTNGIWTLADSFLPDHVTDVSQHIRPKKIGLIGVTYKKKLG